MPCGSRTGGGPLIKAEGEKGGGGGGGPAHCEQTAYLDSACQVGAVGRRAGREADWMPEEIRNQLLDIDALMRFFCSGVPTGLLDYGFYGAPRGTGGGGFLVFRASPGSVGWSTECLGAGGIYFWIGRWGFVFFSSDADWME